MTKLIQLFTLSSLTIFMACGSGNTPASSTDLEAKIKSGKILASKDGVTVSEGYVELLKSINPNLENQLKTPAGKKRLVDNLIEQELLYRESVKRGIHKKAKYLEKAALYERVIISQGLLEEEIEVRAKDYYNKNKEKEFSQVKVSHILFRTRKARPNKKGDKGVTDAQALAKAKEAKTKLDKGAKWEVVVTEYSDDRLTKPRGGDLGKIGRQDRRAIRLQWSDMVDQAFKMKAEEISAPIKARDGYHIIKVTEVASIAPFDNVQNKIKFKLRASTKKDVLSKLSGKGEIEYKDESLKTLPKKNSGIKPGLPIQAKPTTAKPTTAKPAAAKPTTKAPSNDDSHGHAH